MYETDHKDLWQNYDPDGVNPRDLMNGIIANKRHVERTIKNIASLDGRMTEAESSITQNSDEITLRVTKTTYDSDINATDTGLKDRVTKAESDITVNADAITLRVKTSDYNGDTIVSKINLSSDSATISAKNINIDGTVNLSSWVYSGKTTIDGSYVETGTIVADKINTGTLDASLVNVTNINASNVKTGTLDSITIKTPNAGISSDVTTGNDVRIWAGNSYTYRGSAPFRVHEDGSVVANNLALHGGLINMGSGTFDLDNNGNLIAKSAEIHGDMRTYEGTTLLSHLHKEQIDVDGDGILETIGGVLWIDDINGYRNVKVGVEAGTGGNTGGTMILYNDGEANPRVELGIGIYRDASGVYHDYGATILKDYQGYGRIVAYAEDESGSIGSPYYGVFATDGTLKSYIGETNGQINGRNIFNDISGSFTTSDGKTVYVDGGQITGII